MEPPTIPLIKIKEDDESDKDFVKIKLRRYPTLENSDLYEFKMVLFENVNLEEFLFSVRDLNMNLEASGTLQAATKTQ